MTAPVSHQKRPNRSATNAIGLRQKDTNINEADRYPAAHNGLVAGSKAAETRTNSIAARVSLRPPVDFRPKYRERISFRTNVRTDLIARLRQPRCYSFLRCCIQSYDEFIAVIPLRPRLGKMLGMTNTSGIYLIGNSAIARASSVWRRPRA